MPVSCVCDGGDGYEWYYRHRGDFAALSTKRRQRCYSCRKMIDIGADCGVLERYRDPRSEVEERMYGDEVELANKYQCEECYGLLLSVEQAGGCVEIEPGEPMKAAVAEWKDYYPEGCE